MEEVLSRLQGLSPEELRGQVLAAGLKCGPITGTTRAIFERKLARALLDSSGREGSEGTKDSGEEAAVTQVDHGSPQQIRTSSPSMDGQDQSCSSSSPSSSSPGLPRPLEEQGVSEDSHAPGAAPPSHYYVVCPPSTSPGDKETLGVYTDRKKALSVVMRTDGARFKVFSCREEAEALVRAIRNGPSPLTSPSSSSTVTSNSVQHRSGNVEKPNDFKSPRTQDLTAKLRKAVEGGDEGSFRQLVWGNPRYLIGFADNPTIVQEGCRYNVLHVAAKENQPRMAQLVLDTLENPDFLRLMYPDDLEAMLWQRMTYIVDLYLNMPDKTNNETPLHFACKFGCPEVVNVLCSHPATDKQHRNKYNQKPASVICDRKNKSKEMKKKITELLEDRFYVPVLRVADNTLQPVIAGPWSLGVGKCTNNPHETAMSSIDPAMRVTAYAGPLTSSKANKFHKLWKTPPRDRAKYFHDILKSDPDRGVERVGRELAHEQGLPWAEYWEFLDGFVDLTVEQGLEALETYLKHQSSGAACLEPAKKGLASGGSAIISSNGDGLQKEDPTLQVNSRDQRENFSEIGWTSSSEESLANTSSTLVCNLLSKFDSVSPPGDSERDSRDKGGLGLPEGKDLDQPDSGFEGLDQSESGIALLDQSDINRAGLDLSDPGFWGKWHRKKQRAVLEKGTSSGSSDEYLTADEDATSLPERENVCSASLLAGGRHRHCSSSTITSYKSLQSAGWADSSDQSLFLGGDSPTRLDNEVFFVVERTEINPHKYPTIAMWKSTVDAYSAKERQRWPQGSPPKPPQGPWSSTPLGKPFQRVTSPAWLHRLGSTPPCQSPYN